MPIGIFGLILERRVEGNDLAILRNRTVQHALLLVGERQAIVLPPVLRIQAAGGLILFDSIIPTACGHERVPALVVLERVCVGIRGRPVDTAAEVGAEVGAEKGGEH